jgi:hypothetical protein
MIYAQIWECSNRRISGAFLSTLQHSVFDGDQSPVWAYSYRNLEEHVRRNPATLARVSITIHFGRNTLRAGQVLYNSGHDLGVGGHHVSREGADLILMEIARTPNSYASSDRRESGSTYQTFLRWRFIDLKLTMTATLSKPFP